jgi:hypothetical protein
MTGRSEYLGGLVMEILKKHEMYPHRCIFKPDGVWDTLPYKIDALTDLESEFNKFFHIFSLTL